MCRNTLDFELLRNYLNNDFERYIREWFPNAYRLNDATYRTGDFNDSKVKRGDGSLSFNMRDKYAKDFSTDETAGDIISIYAKRFCNGNNGKAFKEIVDRYNLEYLFENYNNKSNNNSNSNNFNNNKKGDYDHNKNRQNKAECRRDRNTEHYYASGVSNIPSTAGENNTKTETTTEQIHLQKNTSKTNQYTVGGCDNNTISGSNNTLHNTNDDFNTDKTKCGIDPNTPADSPLSTGDTKNTPADNGFLCQDAHSAGDINTYEINNTEQAEENTNYTSKQLKAFSSDDRDKYIKTKKVLKNAKPYQKNDPVDLYLKSRGITKYSNDTKIYYDGYNISMINISKDHSKNTIQGIQQIYLTKEGKKKDNKQFPNKIQRTFPNRIISGHPVRLSEKGDNNGYIYITEGVENGLSIQEHINNEVWCSLSIVNIPKIPFENNKIYVIVFDNDYNKETKTVYSTEKENKLKELNIKYSIAEMTSQDPRLREDDSSPDGGLQRSSTPRNDEITSTVNPPLTSSASPLTNGGNAYIIYNSGEYHLKYYVNELSKLKHKHIFYIIPEQKGYDANDLLKENKLQSFLNDTPLKAIECEHILKLNKRTKEAVYWRPQKRIGTNDNDNITKELMGLTYDNEGIARRFLKRYGNIYKKVDGIGICKYDGKGKYLQAQEDELFADIQQTLNMTYYEFDYILDETLMKSFKKLWIDRGIGEFTTVDRVESYVKRLKDLNTDIKDFDNENDNVINLNNGYYDLNTGELHKHSADKLFFRKLDTDYKPNLNLTSINNDWNNFLLSTFCEKINGDYYNDKKGLEKIRFLQKAMGYTFSTSIAEEKLFIVKGITRSGKNTFLDTIQSVMGDYCGDTQDEEFITSREQNSNYLLSIRASLKGKRFLHISEISKNKKLNGAQIKRLVGNRNITAKYMHHNSFSYRQQTKYWIATNNIDFTEFDESIKTKLFIIDFDKRFYDAGTEEAIKTGRVIDRKLKDRLLEKHNQEFIIKWIIDGYKLYKEEGLEQTEEMQEALNQIELDNDSLGMFVKDNMKSYDSQEQYIEGSRADAHEVYKNYTNYEMEEYGTPEDRVISYRKFLKQTRDRGLETKRIFTQQLGRKLYFIGWCLKTEKVMDLNNTSQLNNDNNINNNNNGVDDYDYIPF